jgi:NDP-sugar pyrophosphorylase family protein
MPVVNDENKIIKLYKWNDFFEHKHLEPKFSKPVDVIVMAGGQGTRLKPLTNIIPKPLIPVGEKAIIEVIVDKFVSLGVSQFYFTVNYKYELIKLHFDSITNKNYNLEYVLEDMPLGTAGSMYLLKSKINKTTFVSNCDIVIEEDYNEILKYHLKVKNMITIVGAVKHVKIPYGTLETGEQGELKSFKEKPELTYLINTGFYILEPEILQLIPDNKHIHFTELIEIAQSKGYKTGVFPISEKSWYDIGEWDEYKKIINKYLI